MRGKCELEKKTADIMQIIEMCQDKLSVSREPFLFFELMYCRNSFCYRIENAVV